MKKALSVLFGLVIIFTSIALPQTAMASGVNQVKGVKAVSTTGTAVKLKWKKVSGATGYQVYCSLKKKNGYKKIATVKKGKTVSATVKKLKSNKTYYFKIRAVKKKKTGKFSKIIAVKTAVVVTTKKADKKSDKSIKNSTTEKNATTTTTTAPNEKPSEEASDKPSIENVDGGRD